MTLVGLARELFRRRWTTMLGQKSNKHGMLPCMYCIKFLVWHKCNSLPLGPIQPSSPSTKELHGLVHGKLVQLNAMVSLPISLAMTCYGANLITKSIQDAKVMQKTVFSSGTKILKPFLLFLTRVWNMVQIFHLDTSSQSYQRSVNYSSVVVETIK